jgi:cytochrome oxidase Cu insertion factor (SCO1/SenC/PrrC family)
MTKRSERGAAGARGFLVVVSIAGGRSRSGRPPARLRPGSMRARSCFQRRPERLPELAGWLLIRAADRNARRAGGDLGRRRSRRGLRRGGGAAGGRALLGACRHRRGSAAAAAARVATRARPTRRRCRGDACRHPSLDRAPRAAASSTRTARLELDALRGRPALVTFAFAHCEAVCPAIVRQVVAAQRTLAEGAAPGRVPRVVVVTLDPWRDTPSRLPSLAKDYELGADAFVLSGPVDEVNALLDRWNVARGRDEKTGEVAHPPIVYVLDAEGRIAFAATGGTEALLSLLART